MALLQGRIPGDSAKELGRMTNGKKGAICRGKDVDMMDVARSLVYLPLQTRVSLVNIR